MSLLFYIVIFIFGCAIGSFLNVLIDRLPKGNSVIKGRSHCDNCKKKLGWFDLIPVLSYVLLGGNCRYCGKTISFYYPLVEIITGLLFIFVVFLTLNQNISLIFDFRYIITLSYLLILISSLIVIFFIDLKSGIIPFKIVFFATFATLIWHILSYFKVIPTELNFLVIQGNYVNPVNYLLSGVGMFLLFFSMFFFTRGKGMGFGDVVYVFFMGFLLGFPKVILGMYISVLTGAFIASVLVLMKVKKLRGDVIPFGPFLVLGTMISIFWGNILVDKILLYFFQ